MSRERIFSKYFNIPRYGGEIDVKVYIEYEATNWDQENTGDIDVIDAWLSQDRLVHYDSNKFAEVAMTQSEIDSAQSWLDQTPLDFFYDAAFENECEEWNEPPLSLQP